MNQHYGLFITGGSVMCGGVRETAKYTFGNFTAIEKSLVWSGTDWRYTVSGEGNSYLLAIMSNISGHLLALPLAEDLGGEYRVITLSVPPIKQFSPTAEGLKRILDAEGVSHCHVIGHSNGGVYLQSLIAKHPERVDKIVFSHSLTSMSKDDAFTTNASELKFYKIMRRLLKVLPASLLTYAMAKQILAKLRLKSGEETTGRFIHLCKEDMKRITKQNLLTMADCMEDFLYHYTFENDYYRAKPDKVLLLNSPSDKLVNPEQKEAMRRLCPGSREYQFKRGGHTPMVLCQEEYFRVVKDFLLSPTGEGEHGIYQESNGVW
jgi:pimeloyl-ACP methyl ester carboxylesterase